MAAAEEAAGRGEEVSTAARSRPEKEEGEVGSREVGKWDVKVMWWGVGAEIGEEDGGAEGVEI